MMRNRKKRSLLLGLYVSLALFHAPSVFAEDVFQKGTTEWGLSIGFGDNFNFDGVREDIQFFFLSPLWGKVFKKWDRGGSLEFIMEGFLSYARQESEHYYAVGVTPLLGYNFKDSGKVVPFLEIGAGILYTDLDPEGLGSEFNFTPQMGGGIRYELGPGKLLKLSCRYHHISNAGLAKKNRGINSFLFSIGLSFIH